MKSVRHLLIVLAMVLAVLSTGVASAGTATVVGKVKFVGTTHEAYDENVQAYRSSVLVTVESTWCEGDVTVKDLAIVIQSGPMNDIRYAHRGVDMRNVYSTLLTALLSGKTVNIQGMPDCSGINSIIDLSGSGGVIIGLTN